jgi:hypothetical protein
MYKVEFYFIVNGDWQFDGSETLDTLPEKDGTFLSEGKAYRIIDVKENNIECYEVYLD